MYRQLSLFDTYDDNHSKIKGIVRKLDYDEAMDFIMDKHYAGRKPSVSIAFGWFFDGDIKAAITFGKPSNPYLCKGVCGERYSGKVYELNRLVRVEDFAEQLSQFVAYCLRELRAYDWIIVSYSDMGMHHHGYIYQACNFLYTGCTKERTDMWSEDVKHSRHASEHYEGVRQVRTPKHRYIYFCTSNKRLKREWMKALRYPIMPYPKGDNENYELGTIYRPTLIGKEEP